MHKFKNWNKILNRYISEINLIGTDSTEYSYRTCFHTFLNKLILGSFSVIHEGKKDHFGRPDFKIKKGSFTLGYIETKNINSNLYTELQSNQLDSYTSFIDNFILTNYKEFILFCNSKPILKANIYDDKLIEDQYTKLELLLLYFFNKQLNKISSPKELALMLAEKSKILRDSLVKIIQIDENKTLFSKRFNSLYSLFKDTLISEISFENFIDVYIQTLIYGLFMARLSSTQPINKNTAMLFIPKYLAVVEEIFDLIKVSSFPETFLDIIDDVIETLNNIDLTAFKQNMSFSSQTNEDPYVYFYEIFLKTYNNQERKLRGVFYTPRAIVLFIINSVSKLLKSDFRKSGLADKDITLLDFATGTGTFLLEAFRNTLSNITPVLRDKYIKERLLKNFYGFESQVAPYVMAHLKLYNYLLEENFTFSDNDRIGVYLTDTLNDKLLIENDLYPAIYQESNTAWQVKTRKKILIILGNPPYNDHSVNKSKFILNLMSEYKNNLNERKSHLEDDYIKFIRFAQWKIESQDSGIIALVTNNSYLDGISHKIMRKSLYNTFDKIYILNLHGNPEKKEKGENVFDIQRVGISIIFLVKCEPSLNLEKKQVFYFSTDKNDILSRTEKYNFLLNNDIYSVDWKDISPSPPYYWFTDRSDNTDLDYNNAWVLTDIFKKFTSGIIASKDAFTIHKTQDSVLDVIRDILDLDEKIIARKYNVSESRDWKLSKVKSLITNDLEILLCKKIPNSCELSETDIEVIIENRIVKIHYRPFDFRYTYYYKEYGGFLLCPRYEVMKNLVDSENIALISVRQVAELDGFNHCFITETIANNRLCRSNRGTAFIFPLYIYQNNQLPLLDDKYHSSIVDNFTGNFREYINSKYQCVFPPNKILGYIYAILNSTVYTDKYFENLKYDFPKIIFTKDKDLFNTLSSLGNQLILLHTFKIQSRPDFAPEFCGYGDFKIEKINFINGKIYINANQYFSSISKDAYNLKICGYNVLYKFLSERKSEILSLSEIDYIKNIINALEDTIRLKKKINEVVVNMKI